MKKLLKVLLAGFVGFSTLSLAHVIATESSNVPYEVDCGKRIDKNGWTATADSVHATSGNHDGPGQNLVDNNYSSTWHSAYDSDNASDKTFPHNVVIKFSNDLKQVTFGAFSYTSRLESDATNGLIKDYELYISDSQTELAADSEEWGDPIYTGTFTSKEISKVVLDHAYTARQIKLKALNAHANNNFAGGAEFDLYTTEAVRTPIDHTKIS